MLFWYKVWSFIIGYSLYLAFRTIIKTAISFTQIDELKLWIDYFSLGHVLDALVFIYILYY